MGPPKLEDNRQALPLAAQDKATEPQKPLPASGRVELPAVDEVVKRRMTLIDQLQAFGKEAGIQPGSDSALVVEKAVAKELAIPDGYIAALYYSQAQGAIGKDGIVRGSIRRLESKDEIGTGVPFTVAAKELSGKGAISFSLDGVKIDTEKARIVMPALVDPPRHTEKFFIAHSKDGTLVIRFDEFYPPNEGTGGFDQSTSMRVYRNGKPLESLNAVSVAQSGQKEERWQWKEGEMTHTVIAKVNSRLKNTITPLTREYQSVTVDGIKLEMWK